MKKIKEIKIVNQDESTEVANIGADAINVDYNDTTVKAELDKLNATDNTISNEQTRQRTTLNNLESEISSLASGSPKGTYATTADLVSANPNTGVYIVTANGHIYSWTKNGSSAIDLGVYQSTGLDTNTQKVINNALIYKGNITELGYNNVDDIKTRGIYTITTAQASTFLELPDNKAVGGVLLVTNPSSASGVTQEYYNLYGDIYHRYYDSKWTFWKKTTAANSLCYQNSFQSLGYTSLYQAKASGYYLIGIDWLSNITDLPEDFGSGRAYLLVLDISLGEQPTTPLRILVDRNNIWLSIEGGNFISVAKKDSFAYHGNVIDFGYSTFAECKNTGYYSFTSANIADITDKPRNLIDGGWVEVYNYVAANVRMQIIRDFMGRTWYRYGNDVFKQLNETSTYQFFYRGSVVNNGNTTFNNCNKDGYYSFTRADLENITDKPTDLASEGKLIVYSTNLKIIITNDGSTWIKAGGSNSWARIVNSYRGRITSFGYTTFAQCTRDGYYIFYTADLEELTDKPSNITYGGNLVVDKVAANVLHQVITDLKGNKWEKIYNSGTFGSNWKQIYDATPAPEPVAKSKWIALGDSITEEYVSWFTDEEETTTNYGKKTGYGWVTYLKNLCNYELTNIAIGGTGYMHLRTQDTEDMRGCNVAKNTDFSDYDFVTLAYGINDWKGNNPLGTWEDNIEGITTPTTVMQAMKMTIEAIYASNPNIKVFVILPFYCHGYGHQYDNTDDYCINYRYTKSGTLQEFCEEMIKVCDYYHIQYIDMLHYNVINRLNVLKMCPDGIHPSYRAHELIAHELSKKITFI